MSADNLGPIKVSLERDSNGDRTYRITYHVRTTDTSDGPAVVITCPGLPSKGDEWEFGNDIDPWAFCLFDGSVRMATDKLPTRDWYVDFVFSTKLPGEGGSGGSAGGHPTGNGSTGGGGSPGRGTDGVGSCKTEQTDDPLLVPPTVSGGFIKYVEEAATDRNGFMITNSAFEQFRGPKIEFDNNRPTVSVEQNVADLQLPLLAQFMDCVNDSPMWGNDRRCVKLSNVTWRKLYYGRCYSYYTRRLEFDINTSTFDRRLLDEGTKALNGHWDPITGLWKLDLINGELPDPTDAGHYIVYKDRNGDPGKVVLNGAGIPTGVITPSVAPIIAYKIIADPTPGANLPDAGDFPESVRPYPIGTSVFAHETPPGITEGSRHYFTVTAVVNGQEIRPHNPTFSTYVIARSSFARDGFGGTAQGMVFTFRGVLGATEYHIYWAKEADGALTSLNLNGVVLELRLPDTFKRIATITPEDSEGEIPAYINVEKYKEANFFLLGIPASF